MLTNALVIAQSDLSDNGRDATIYTIFNIKIDQTATNVTAARDAALINGQRLALERLFRRIILISDRPKLPEFSNNQIMELISGYEINDERRSGVRYIASLIVHFNRSKIHEILSEYQIPYAETLGIAVSILPVFEDGATLTLWEKANHWRLAWKDYDVSNNLVPINTPEPTLKNRMYINALQAKSDNQTNIQTFIEQNKLNELIIATATIKKDMVNNQALLTINLKRNTQIETDTNSQTDITVSAPLYDEIGDLNLNTLYLKGIDASTDWIDDLWKSKVLVNYGVASKIRASGTLNDLNDWLIMEKQLKKVNLVRNVNLLAITINTVNLEIEFAGDSEQLALSLAQQGLKLNQDKDQNWLLTINEYAASQGLNRQGIDQ